jgi:alanyl-tRNA synthetase
MKTIRAYYEVKSAGSFPAQILELRPWEDKAAVILDRTIFYPEGGGQGADRGFINGIPVPDVREKDDEIFHIVTAEDAGRLAPGPAELTLDWERRRDFTIHHTAQHLLSGTILRLTGSPTVSMHLGDEVCTIDVDTPAITEETLIAIEDAVAAAIEGDAPVITHLCPPENAGDFPLRKVPPQGEEVIRVVEIEGHDFSPCCGTHARSTGEIGILRILGAEKYKGKTRIFFIAGRRVLRDSRMLRKNGDVISRALKVPVTEIGQGTLALLDRADRLERRVKALEEEAAGYKAEALLRKAGLVGEDGTDRAAAGRIHIECLPGDMEEVLRIGRAAQKLTGAILVTASEQEAKFAALCSAPSADIRSILKAPMEARGGRGGGGPSFFQGQFPSGEDLRAFLGDLPEKAEGPG